MDAEDSAVGAELFGGDSEVGRDAAELGDQPGLRLPAKNAKRPHKKGERFWNGQSIPEKNANCDSDPDLFREKISPIRALKPSRVGPKSSGKLRR
jgi:hypothetical protein